MVNIFYWFLVIFSAIAFLSLIAGGYLLIKDAFKGASRKYKNTKKISTETHTPAPQFEEAKISAY